MLVFRYISVKLFNMNKKGWTLVITLILIIGGVSVLLIYRGEEIDIDMDENGTERTEDEHNDVEDTEDIVIEERNDDADPEAEREGISKQELTINYSATYFGYSNSIQIFEDRTFLITDDGGEMSGGSGEKECYKGKISTEDQASIIDLIESIEFLNMEIEQASDPRLICEGSVSLTVGVDGDSNSIRMPCVVEHTALTEEIGQAISDIKYKVNEILEPIKTTCDSREVRS